MCTAYRPTGLMTVGFTSAGTVRSSSMGLPDISSTQLAQRQLRRRRRTGYALSCPSLQVIPRSDSLSCRKRTGYRSGMRALLWLPHLERHELLDLLPAGVHVAPHHVIDELARPGEVERGVHGQDRDRLVELQIDALVVMVDRL